MIARIGISQGRLDEAAVLVDRAAAIDRAALPAGHPFFISVLQTKAALASATGDHAKAEEYYREALALAESVFKLDHPTRLDAIDRVVGALWVQGKFAEAERIRRELLAEVEREFGPDHAAIARALRGLGSILANSARLEEAASADKQALAIDEKLFGAQSSEAALDHLAIGSILRRAGRYIEASAEITRARSIWDESAYPAAAASATQELAALASDQGRDGEALALMEGVLNTREQEFGSGSPVLVSSIALLGKFYLNVGRSNDAEQMASRAALLLGADPAEQVGGFLPFMELRAAIEAQRGNLPAAQQLLERALAIATKQEGAHAGTVALEDYNLATTHLRSGEFQQALDGYSQALDIAKNSAGPRSPVVGYMLLAVSQTYARMGDATQAALLLLKAVDILSQIRLEQRPYPKWL